MSNTQLRGKRLETAIKDAILKLAKNKKDFKLNQSKLAELVGTSRPTLNKHKDLIDKILADLKATRRESTGNVEREHLQEKIISQQKTIQDLKNEIQMLRENHVEIYEKLSQYSVKISELINPIIQVELVSSGKCLTCGQKIAKEMLTKKTNVVDISKRRK